VENRLLTQPALLDLSIVHFGLMRACRREDAPLRIDRYTIRDGFLLVRLISGVNISARRAVVSYRTPV
jgi:hypothetical protein